MFSVHTVPAFLNFTFSLFPLFSEFWRSVSVFKFAGVCSYIKRRAHDHFRLASITIESFLLFVAPSLKVEVKNVSGNK